MNRTLLNSAAAIAFIIWGLAAAAETQTVVVKKPEQIDNVKKTGDLGIGLKVGPLSGITAKFWRAESEAGDVSVTFENGNTAFGIGYSWQFRDAFGDQPGYIDNSFVPYLGAGLVTAVGSASDSTNRNSNGHRDSIGLAVQVPFGIEYLPVPQQFGVFAELTPGIGLMPWSFSYLTGGIGARYYF